MGRCDSVLSELEWESSEETQALEFSQITLHNFTYQLIEIPGCPAIAGQDSITVNTSGENSCRAITINEKQLRLIAN